MLQLRNKTPFKAEVTLLPDAQGVDTVYTVVKGTFTIGDRVSIADEQVAVALADEYHGKPGASSVRLPSDVGLVKPATDVLLLGHACGPGGRPTPWVDVSLSVGPLRKTVRVFGDRTWKGNGVGYSITAPEPFERMPLVWERAYGGTDVTDKGPTAEPRNPVGVGFRASGSDRPIAGTPVPNLEDPAAPIASRRDTPPPACFAPIAPHWQPRVSYGGTYDEAWQQRRAPYLPDDFDARFFQVAPPALIASGYLRGGEPVEVRGATPSGSLRFPLPSLAIETMYVIDDARQRVPANLETVIIEPDESRVQLVWRAALRCDKKALRVTAVLVAAGPTS